MRRYLVTLYPLSKQPNPLYCKGFADSAIRGDIEPKLIRNEQVSGSNPLVGSLKPFRYRKYGEPDGFDSRLAFL